MNNNQIKLENPVRLEELNPTNTLKKIGLQENHILCDIGAGSGIFTIPAARITRKEVYALDINDEMLSIISRKAEAESITNIELIKVKDDHFEIMDNSIDIALLVTVLHEIQNPAVFLTEIKRILKNNGQIAVIEFHKRDTPIGPPINHRMGKDEVTDQLKNIGFIVHKDFDLGDNFYCLVFQMEIA
jgi:ubiquinone/menaquinone biosynthesis C-methylase UbiE